jgi:hypothetical protein
MDVIHARCAGLDVHKKTVVACVRVMADGAVRYEVRTFGTTTRELMTLGDWLRAEGCTHAVLESTGRPRRGGAQQGGFPSSRRRSRMQTPPGERSAATHTRRRATAARRHETRTTPRPAAGHAATDRRPSRSGEETGP